MIAEAAELLAIDDAESQRRRLALWAGSKVAHEHEQLAEALKIRSDQMVRAELSRCFQASALILHLAELTGNLRCRALGLLAQANGQVIGLGDYQKGLACYDEAAAIYAQLGDKVREAQTQTGRLWALASLGHYQQAFAAGEWAAAILEKQEEWLALAKMTSNVAAIYGRLGQDAEALPLIEQAREAYRRLGTAGELPLLRVEINRVIVLRNLGRFQEAIESNQAVLATYAQLGLDQTAAIANAQHELAITYFVQGRYNESLILLDQARNSFLADGQQRHASLVELFTTDCLLQLRRFSEVLEKCAQVRAGFRQLHMRLEEAQVILYEARALAGLRRYPQARQRLAEARRLLEQEENQVAVADADLHAALILLAQNEPGQSLSLAQACIALYGERGLPAAQAWAYLVAARAALALEELSRAQDMVACAAALATRHQLPALVHESNELRGALALRQGQPQQALAAYAAAIDELERLYGRLMLEFRADFLAGKERLYEDAVSICLELNQPELGLAYSERARSRALQEMLGHRLSLRIEARSPADRPLVDELLQLRAERDRIYRRWETGERVAQRGRYNDFSAEKRLVAQSVLDLEKRITALWHQLLIRNADYAADASLWQVRTEPIQPYLEPGTVLVEYFMAHGRPVAFVVTAGSCRATRLPATLAQVQHLLQLLWLNLRSAPQSRSDRLSALTENARGILHRLYGLLIEPLVEELAPYRQLIIVPHGPLHYLPFHALHNGQGYLLEQWEISYLPGASLLRHCCETEVAEGGLLAVGHSLQGRLPFAVEEARSIATAWEGQALLEQEATLSRFCETAPQKKLLHLATHGDFRVDNPLFSGLALADGWLTTLDVFNLRLQASLVTLSACETGRSLIGGGDELLGLMRAVLAAGAASLLASFWAVEDSSTAEMMRSFYGHLAKGQRKGQALRRAQRELIEAGSSYSHPYFWAPFFLVGDAGPA
jgi:CHAT domain-containing protein